MSNNSNTTSTVTKWPIMKEFTIEWHKYVRPLDVEKSPSIDDLNVKQILDQIKYLGEKVPDNYPKYPNVVLDIVQYKNNPHILRQKSFDIPVELVNDVRIKYFSLLMLLTLLLSEDYVNVAGIGLSAIQVGVPYKIFWAYVDKINQWEVFFNPIVTAYDETIVTKKEGCLSILGVNVPVPRKKAVKVKYINSYGVTSKLILKNLDARVVQHEYDHLLGKLIVDY